MKFVLLMGKVYKNQWKEGFDVLANTILLLVSAIKTHSWSARQ